MLNHQGTVNLEIERLILRRFKLEDADEMYRNWASDSEVTRYLSWKEHKSVNETRDTINNLWVGNYCNLEVYEWGIEIKETGELIGSISLINIDNVNESCEVGYCLGRSYWNKGIVTESFKAVLEFAFSAVGFHRIIGRHFVDNPASGEVMKKCNLQYEGTLRKVIKNNKGEFVCCKLYSILKEECR